MLEFSLPELGFGAAQLGNLYKVTTDDEATGAVNAAWEGGLRHFDTAPHYGIGLSEERLGRVLSHHDRDDFVLSSKVGRLVRPGPGGGDDLANGYAVSNDRQRVWDVTAAGVRRSIEESLTRLGLERLDIAYLHDPEEGPEHDAFTQALPALVALRDEGVVRAVGVGSKSSTALLRGVTTCDIDLIMLSGRYTLLEQGADTDLLPACVKNDVGVVAVSVFNSGILSQQEIPADASYEYGAAPQLMMDRARELAAVAARYDTTLPAMAMKFPLRHPAIKSVVLGMRTAEQVDSNLATWARAVPEAAWAEVAALHEHWAHGS